VKKESFVDYYELLQVSPNADEGTIQRVFRHLAKIQHPDTPGGDADCFNRLVDAYKTLSNPESRAAYDVRYQQFWEGKWQVAADASQARRPTNDDGIRERLLTLFYAQRRGNMRNPGMGNMELARLTGCPTEIVEFHLWYLKEKGWIARLETGAFAITAVGVDQIEHQRPYAEPHKLLEATGFHPGSDDPSPDSTKRSA
jgi:curved DNA-binding protein CbpA